MAISSLPRRVVAGTAAASAALLVLAGCGGSSSSDDAASGPSGDPLPTVEADDDLSAMVPDSISSDGVISVGSDTTYAPAEFIAADGKTIEGFDVDLFTLVGQRLGLKVQFETAPFDNIIAGVGSGKYEVGVSSFTINPDRLQAANMVSYFDAGTQWVVQADNPKGIDPEKPCGISVAVQKASIQVADVTARSQACVDDGQPAAQINQYDGQDQVIAAVASGKNDALLGDSPSVAYAVTQTDGQLELLGDVYDSAPYGYVVPLEETDFAQALADAVQSLIDDGSYQQVLEQWGVEAGGIDDPTVNPTVS